MTAVRALTVTAGVLLSIVAVFLVVVAAGLFLDGSAGAGGLTVFFVMITGLCALLLFRAVPARRAVALPARRPRRRDGGLYYGDPTPGYSGDSHHRWGGDGGADGSGSGHGHGGGWGGSDAGADGGSSGSDGGGGSDGGSSSD